MNRLRAYADRKRRESCAQEELGGAKVVHRTAKSMLAGAEHVIDEHSIRPRASHDDEVARRFAVCSLNRDFAYGDLNGPVFELFERRTDRIEWELEVTRQRIGAAERDNTEDCGGMRDETLQNVVDGAVATTGEDEVCTASACLVGLPSRCSGAFRGGALRLYAVKAESLRDPLNDAEAR